eukprot:COSAG05_NODE_1013_length_6190_cov_4.171236_8_plen_52_part_00
MLLGDVLLRPFAAWRLQCSVATLQAKGHIHSGGMGAAASQAASSRKNATAG